MDFFCLRLFKSLHIQNKWRTARRMLKKAVQQGRSE
jgi:hypothetical protein